MHPISLREERLDGLLLKLHPHPLPMTAKWEESAQAVYQHRVQQAAHVPPRLSHQRQNAVHAVQTLCMLSTALVDV